MAVNPRYPIWSPDGTMLGFSDQKQTAICRVCGAELIHMWDDCKFCDLGEDEVKDDA